MSIGEQSPDPQAAIYAAARERFDRAVAAMRKANTPFAVCGENATGIWIEQVDEGAVRGTPLIEFFVSRANSQIIESSLEESGFRKRSDEEPIQFADERTNSKFSSVVLHFEREKDFADQLADNPGVDESEAVAGLPVLSLRPLVGMLLARYRTIDRVMTADLAGVGLVDRSWIQRFDGVIAERLLAVLDDFDEDRRCHPISNLPLPDPPPGTVPEPKPHPEPRR
jgi:hypothetical protein